VSPTLGTVLRLVFGEELFRLQFVPLAAGLVWFAWHYRRKAAAWDWAEQLPLLMLVSFVTAPYGAWPFDMVLLLPAALAVVVGGRGRPTPTPSLPGGEQDPESSSRRAEPPLFCSPSLQGGGRGVDLYLLLLINLGCLVLNLFQVGSFWFLWVAPAVLLVYATQARRAPAPVALKPIPVTA
jgi:hypothetical protein